MKTTPVANFVYEHSVNKKMHPCQHIFDFYSNVDKNKLGTLVCHKSELQIRPNYEGNVLAIDFLEATHKNQGIGTNILKFAEKYSEQIGCKGFMTLKADGYITPNRIPHIFYRKFGFSTLEKSTDKKLDKFIKKQTNATTRDFPGMLMHYPPSKEKISVLKSLFNKICKYL